MYLQDISLSQYSTIKTGGPATYFKEIQQEDQLKEGLEFAKSKGLPTLILGEGSNCLFSDSGYQGLVLKNNIKGISIIEENDTEAYLDVSSGENWDYIVDYATQKGLSGIECLSGIPGTVGATPIQNVGAYGQEVSQSIHKVNAICLKSFETKSFSTDECSFSYRQSRFKQEDKNKYFIKSVIFKLNKKSIKPIVYQELLQHLKAKYRFKTITDHTQKLIAIRQAVIDIRKKKSMVIDAKDINSQSLGSFFMNPVLSKDQYTAIKPLLENTEKPCPVYKFNDGFKASAAWLIDNSGFHKGHTYKNIGLSKNHCLAIANLKQGSTGEILELAKQIQDAVQKNYQIDLHIEPNVL